MAQSTRKTAASSTEKASTTEPTTEAPATGATNETGTGDTTPAAAAQAPAAGSGDSGPGTGAEAPAETGSRYPSTLVDPGGNPLDPPQDAAKQTQPEQGHNASSTDHVYAATGGRTVAGEDHLGLVDEDGNDLSESDLFEDADPAKTFVVTKGRIYEEFYYPNTTEKASRLLYAAGRRVPRDQAEKVKQALKDAPTPTAEKDA